MDSSGLSKQKLTRSPAPEATAGGLCDWAVKHSFRWPPDAQGSSVLREDGRWEHEGPSLLSFLSCFLPTVAVPEPGGTGGPVGGPVGGLFSIPPHPPTPREAVPALWLGDLTHGVRGRGGQGRAWAGRVGLGELQRRLLPPWS